VIAGEKNVFGCMVQLLRFGGEELECSVVQLLRFGSEEL
jgi:hypothetical protein